VNENIASFGGNPAKITMQVASFGGNLDPDA
jgi:carboxylesterase type B